VLTEAEGQGDTSRLVGLMREEGVTVVMGVPSLLEALVEEPGLEECRELRTIITGGEVLMSDLKERVVRRVPGAELYNFYGPTEATINASVWRCERREEGREEGGEEGQRVPIGRPVSNVEVYLLDREMEVVGVGVAAELYIGGAGLARGYVERAEQTAERFVPHPYAAEPGKRLYRTGDIARYGSDGRVEYLGRRDNQVKLRGYRIELGEIEAALRTFDGIRQGIVVLRGEGAGRRLVAFLVADSPEQPMAGELRSYLAKRLPEYMIPAAFVFLDELPRLPSGKVDQRRLPAPERPAKLSDGFVAPRDLIELQLAQVWEEVLGIEPIGVRDNFFDLGGHSILAARLMSRIERAFGTKLPLVTLFKSPTIEHLASLLRREAREAERFSELVEIQPGGTRRPLFCAHPTGGNVLCYAELSRQLGPEQPFYAFQARGMDPSQEPRTSIKEMAAAYVEKLREVQPEGPYYLGGWSLGGVVAYEMAQQLLAHGQQVDRLFLFDAPPPLRRGKMRSAVRPLAQLWSMADDEDPLMPLYAFGQELGLNIRSLSLDREQLVKLQPDGQVSFVMEHAKEAALLPPDFDEGQFLHLFRVFRHNLNASRHYAARPYAGRITLFISDERLIQGGGRVDPISGWERLTRGGFEKVVVPGGHFVMLHTPHVKTLAAKLSPYLEAAPAAQPPLTEDGPDAEAPISS
jgi:thioesterase domain-containing protein/acyl carrier protein